MADILQHQAGFAPDPQFHNDKFNQVTQLPDPNTDNVLYAIGKDKVAEAICKAPWSMSPAPRPSTPTWITCSWASSSSRSPARISTPS